MAITNSKPTKIGHRLGNTSCIFVFTACNTARAINGPKNVPRPPRTTQRTIVVDKAKPVIDEETKLSVTANSAPPIEARTAAKTKTTI